MLIPHLQQKHTHRRGKKSPLICWAFFLGHYRQSSNVCNTVLVRASREYKRGFETNPFAVGFAQIRALASKPQRISAVHRRKKAQSRLINCSLSVTVFCSAQFSGKIWELNVEAKRIPTALLPTHWNASKPHPAKGWACSPQPLLATGSQESLRTPKHYLEVLPGLSHPLHRWQRLTVATATLVYLHSMNGQEGKNFPPFHLYFTHY